MAPKSSSWGAPKVAAAVILGGGLAPGFMLVFTNVMMLARGADRHAQAAEMPLAPDDRESCPMGGC
jgi:hypothetical protein